MSTNIVHRDHVATRKLDPKKRSIDFVASTETLDSHNTVIDQASWKLERFLANPVLLFEHGAPMGILSGSSERPEDKIPIARAENVRVEGGKLLMTAVFRPEGQSKLADDVWNAFVSGHLNAFSVGFRPGKVERIEPANGSTEKPYYRFTDNELCEVSIVGIPSNPDAVARRSAEQWDQHRLAIVESSRGPEVVPTATTTAPARTAIVYDANVMVRRRADKLQQSQNISRSEALELSLKQQLEMSDEQARAEASAAGFTMPSRQAPEANPMVELRRLAVQIQKEHLAVNGEPLLLSKALERAREQIMAEDLPDAG